MGRPPKEKDSALFSLHCRVGENDYEKFLQIVKEKNSTPSSFIRKFVQRTVLDYELKP
jgi:hypothetical protein